MTQSHSLVLIRHAQSTWNKEGLFTGWADPELTEHGVEEAREAASLLQAAGIAFDRVYCSVLSRARQTAEIILAGLGQETLAIQQDWRLNERHYGDLQGLNKENMAEKVGVEQVLRWRRGYEDLPPPMAEDDERHPRFDARYTNVDPALLPTHENLKMTRERVMGFWREFIIPDINRGQRVLISAHGNTLRALLMDLHNISPSQVETFEIPTGTPIICQFHDDQFVDWRYLQDSD